MKKVVKALRALPAVQPPSDLSRRILDSLPHRRGFMGRLEYALNFKGSSAGSSKSPWLPSGPDDLGLFVLSAGFFFCCLTAVIWLWLPLLGWQPAFMPTLAASFILIVIGWRQIHSPRLIITFWPGLAAVCGLFATALSLGLSSDLRPEQELIAAWLGMSGLAMVGVLEMMMAVSRRPAHIRNPNNAFFFPRRSREHHG